jgi:hypothetical protein
MSAELRAGDRVGPYEIVARIGAGGMGEVFRARDAKLRRDVALKVLPRTHANDAAAVERFEREAHAVAALSHPNILSIFDFGVHDGAPYAAMELLEGETLRDRLRGGPLPLRQAIDFAIQIAEALAAAHEKGIVHRDLKPENIFITTESRAKVLDFGLAKQTMRAAAPAEDTPTERRATTPGTVMGTVGYMSPEQVRGLEVDARSDIFSFGAVLYEMLSGRRAFGGDSAVEVMNAILKNDVEALDASTDAVPPAVARVVEHCLEKDPRKRFQAARDVAFALGALGEMQRTSSRVAAIPARRRWPLAAAAAAAVAALAFAGALWSTRRAPHEPIRVIHSTASGVRVTLNSRPLLSPDGARLAYVVSGQLRIERLDDAEASPLVVSPAAVGAAEIFSFFWSHDGTELAFVADRRLWRLATTGGTPSLICSIPESGRIIGGDWNAEGEVVFAVWRGSLYRVAASGGQPQVILRMDPRTDVDVHYPQFLPDGRGILYLRHFTMDDNNSLEVLAGEKRVPVRDKRLPRDPGRVVYDGKGHLLCEHSEREGIWAVPFSLADLRPTGAASMVIRNGTSPSVGADGTLLWVRGAIAPAGELVRVTRDGHVTQVLGAPASNPQSPAVSPSGSHIAVSVRDEDRWSVWVYDVARGGRSRIADAGEADAVPWWSPSGERILFASSYGVRSTVRSVTAAGGADERVIAVGSNVTSAVLTADERRLVYTTDEGGGAGSIRMLPVDPNLAPAGAPQVLAKGALMGRKARVPPQGDLLVYTSFVNTQREIFLQQLADGKARWQVSTSGGVSPAWNASGDRIYYLSGDDLMEVDVRRAPSVTLSAPRKLFSLRERGLRAESHFDVDREGNFVMVRDAGEPPKIVVGINGARLIEKAAR